jgi:dCTP deaminase
MVLSQPDLRQSVKDGKIVFDPPLEEDQWGEASVDLRLDFSFTMLKSIQGIQISVAQGLGGIGKAGFWQTKNLRAHDEFGRPETMVLKKREFVLAMTHERVMVPRDMIALVEGRTTYARVGLSMHQTAPWIQPGWDGKIVLEIMNNGPIDIILTPLVDRPCQLTFFKLTSELPELLAYGSRSTDVYQRQQHPIDRSRS